MDNQFYVIFLIEEKLNYYVIILNHNYFLPRPVSLSNVPKILSLRECLLVVAQWTPEHDLNTLLVHLQIQFQEYPLDH